MKKDTSRNSLFDVMFITQNLEVGDLNIDGIQLEQYKFNHGISQFDMTMTAMECDDEILFSIDYATKLFKEETMERFVEHFVNAVKDIVVDTDKKISDIKLISDEERNKLLYEFNDTDADYPRDKTLQKIFEECVEKVPDRIAVVFEGDKLTYRELNERANSLARVLREKGVKADSIVGIMVEKSLEMIVGIMGILKAGGAYLPIDPNYPKERVEYVLDNSKTSIILTHKNFCNGIDFTGEIIDLEDASMYSSDTSNLGTMSKPSNLAYVIYTSGSTGRPKGVMIEHHAIVNRLNWMQKKYPLTSEDVILQKTTFTFDVSVWELFLWSLSGSKLCFIKPEGEKDPQTIIDTIEKNNITTMHFVPSMLNVFLEYIDTVGGVERVSSLRNVFSSGEALGIKQVERFKRLLKEVNGTELFNLYGPTEAAVDVTYFDCLKEPDLKIVPIGKPIDNIKLYILDKNLEMNQIGVSGELYISGEGLARGYLNNAELTSERFIENPFEPGKKMYKTGDIARWLADGNIEYLGRSDSQVKIRGFRIELGEIENRIMEYESVKEAVVIVRNDSEDNKYLCAYIVADKEITVMELRAHLSNDLPDYMIPTYFIKLEKIPLTHNGKVDRKTLLLFNENMTIGVEYIEPRNEIEEKLSVIWNEILGIKNISVKDNFFEIGGHSLKLTTLMTSIHREFEVKVSLSELFKIATIEKQAEYIQAASITRYREIEKVEEREYYPSSSAQKRMYVIQESNKDKTNYNVPDAMLLVGKLDKERLNETFKKLIIRHKSLRTSFEILDGEVVQKIWENVEFNIENYEVKDESEVEAIISSFVRLFNLSEAPLIRVGLIKVEDTKHILMVDMHHIICDGVSMGIIIDEIGRIYQGEKLEELPIQYVDYAVWQNKNKEEINKRQKKYWLERFSGEIPVLNFPTDYVRPVVQSFEGETLSFSLDKSIKEKLNKIAEENNATLYMVLLSTLNILLHKYTGQEDIIIGSPVAGRTHGDLEKVVGMFVNTLAMRNKPTGEKTFKEFLKEVRENAFNAYENQDYQFEELIENLKVQRDTSRNSLFDVMFITQNLEVGDLNINGIEVENYNFQNKISKIDMALIAEEDYDQILFYLEYDVKLFKKETMERFIDHFINAIKDIVLDTEKKISNIEIISEEEKNKLLYKFNNTKKEYPKYMTVIELFEEIVEKYKDSIALSSNKTSITYKELNEKANKIANLLRSNGVGRNTVVGIISDRTIETVIGVLGIVKAGGVYMPIDEEYPEERICYMIEDSESKIVIGKKELISRYNIEGVKTISIDGIEVEKESAENLEIINKIDDLIYIIYTSGSTGKPKGVAIEQRNIIRLVNDTNILKVSKDDVILKTMSMAFDPSTVDIWGTFLNGIELHMINKDIVINPKLLESVILKNNVTIMQLPAALFNQYGIENIDVFKKLKYIHVGGDVISPKALKTVLQVCEELKVINTYGPTENTVISTAYTVESKWDENDVVPIGKPIENSTAYILGANNSLLPIGAIGELCVGGDGLARGYINRDDLTKEKFIENPYIKGDRIYKTGDFARWLPDGNIEFLGRKDEQVKIRGFRIEMGEIENIVLSYPKIREVVLLLRQESGKELCLYYTGEGVEVAELKAYMLDRLPAYMIPTYIMKLESMPLTKNDKVDRKALPKPEMRAEAEWVAPRNEVESKLAEMWREILGIEKVGVKDNFFELGGHSLKVTMLMTRIQKEFEVPISLSELFKFVTIERQGKYIQKLSERRYDKVQNDNLTLLKMGHNDSMNLFLVPGADGDSSLFIDLSNLLDDKYTCWGIDSNLLKEYEVKDRTIEEIADEYLERISKVQKKGPYHLIGHSAGGAIIFEMARKLLDKNEELGELIFVDTVFPGNKFESFERNEVLESIEEVCISEISNSDETNSKKDKMNKFELLKDRIPEDIKVMIPNIETMALEELVRSINTIRTISKAYIKWLASGEVNKLKMKASYLRAKDGIENGYINCKLHFSEKVEQQVILGNHYSMLKNPNVKQIVEYIEDKLKIYEI
ncbi:non-ribosomal peptide synthetase [Clostridium sp. HBUAS56017]|uniref:non-ribosomal peptide synthetase n=1 Tax=Clostridium sp. HBUAS56017 TaxID=2571128 RepID=UPI001A9B8F65|nr:non-ribosomal peptide synthetase [Clostridium sp. HBUAS56017]